MRIRWTDPALHDLTEICNHSNAHFGPIRARRTALQLYEAVDSLAKLPHIGRSGRTPGTSELVIRGLLFVVVYRIKKEAVEIVRILHGAQRWP